MAPDVRNKISSRLKKKQYVSEDVRRHLEKFGRLLVRDYNPEVRFINLDTARTRIDGDRLLIEITDGEHPQPVTNIEDSAWQLLAREALLIHEIGHVLYTDFDAYEELVEEKIPMGEKRQFHQIYNAAEDAAIDQQLRWKFDCGQELDVHLLNLFSKKKRPTNVNLFHAVFIAILEKGVYSVGVLDEYQEGKLPLVDPKYVSEFDEALDMVDEMLADVMSEPVAKKRYDRIYQFWKDLKDLCPDVEKYQEEKLSWADILPDDSEGGTPGMDADELEDMDPEDVKEFVVQVGQPPTEEEEESDNEQEAESSSPEDGESDEADGETGESQSEGETKGKDSEEEETDESQSSGGSGGEDGHGPGGGWPDHEGHDLVIRD